MRIKSPVLPLVFRFGSVSAMMNAVAVLYGLRPDTQARLCLFAGRYYLAVGAGLTERPGIRSGAGEFGRCLGAAPVLYAFCAEHGREISQNAVIDLGGALCGGKG